MHTALIAAAMTMAVLYGTLFIVSMLARLARGIRCRGPVLNKPQTKSGPQVKESVWISD